MTVRLHGRFDGGFGWNAQPGEYLARSSTALAEGGKVWLIDPIRVPGLEDMWRRLGELAGIVVTLARHDRDAGWLATLHGVPIYLPHSLGDVRFDAHAERVDDRVPNSPLRLIAVDGRGPIKWWRESAVWWPERRVLVTGDVLGNAGYFVLPEERLAVHPLRRFSPPVELSALRPDRVYPGHGQSIAQGAAAAVEHAIRTSRSEALRAWWHVVVRTGGR
ncbi:MAG: MBL fold metallo-hydrolase [Chloroflexi bacterium]|nr:MBL fold metallo-hydrolase [Chloroflexota bacterium]